MATPTNYETFNDFVPSSLSAITSGSTFILTDVTGAVQRAGDIATTQFLLPMTGSSSLADGEKGLAPKPVSGDESKFLRGDGTWADVPSSGGGTPFGFVTVSATGGDYTTVAQATADNKSLIFIVGSVSESTTVSLDSIPASQNIVIVLGYQASWTLSSGVGINAQFTALDAVRSITFYGYDYSVINFNPSDSPIGYAITGLASGSQVVVKSPFEITSYASRSNGGQICEKQYLVSVDLSHLSYTSNINLVGVHAMNFWNCANLKTIKNVRLVGDDSSVDCYEILSFQDGGIYDKIAVNGSFAPGSGGYLINTIGNPVVSNFIYAPSGSGITGGSGGIISLGGSLSNIKITDTVTTSQGNVIFNSGTTAFNVYVSDGMVCDFSNASFVSKFDACVFKTKNTTVIAEGSYFTNCDVSCVTDVTINGKSTFIGCTLDASTLFTLAGNNAKFDACTILKTMDITNDNNHITNNRFGDSGSGATITFASVPPTGNVVIGNQTDGLPPVATAGNIVDLNIQTF